jgi:DNA-binding XRE family transcriptional regulator
LTNDRDYATVCNMMIIDKLMKLQKLERLSDAKFAQKIGIHRTSWIRIKTGKTKMTVNFLQLVLVVYPGLKKDVNIFLLQNATKCN